jgi:hypothetical protein
MTQIGMGIKVGGLSPRMALNHRLHRRPTPGTGHGGGMCKDTLNLAQPTSRCMFDIERWVAAGLAPISTDLSRQTRKQSATGIGSTIALPTRPKAPDPFSSLAALRNFAKEPNRSDLQPQPLASKPLVSVHDLRSPKRLHHNLIGLHSHRNDGQQGIFRRLQFFWLAFLNDGEVSGAGVKHQQIVLTL